MREFAKTYLKNALLLESFAEQLSQRNELVRDFAYLGVHPYLTKVNMQGRLDVTDLDPSGRFSPSASSTYHLQTANHQKSRSGVLPFND